MTKFLTKAALAATALTALATPAMAANSDTKDFTASATIVKPLSLANDRNLAFGTITMRPTLAASTTVTVGANGVASACNTAVLVCPAAADQQTARFTATGVYGQELDVDVGSVGGDSLTSGTDSLTFTAHAPGSVTLGAAAAATPGSVSFDIGGSIDIAPSTADGAYTGTIPVTVTYK